MRSKHISITFRLQKLKEEMEERAGEIAEDHLLDHVEPKLRRFRIDLDEKQK